MRERKPTGGQVDIVVTWVNGSDPEWLSQKSKYRPDNAYGDSRERYYNWELMRYWFRGIEQNAPWVRKVHFVTWGHYPEWLDTDCEKLQIVRHDEIMPEEILPCFNSSVIELYAHRIPDIAERFVLFNDDFFLLRPVKESFFFREGLPCDMLAFQPVIANPKNPIMSHIYLNNMLILSKYFEKRKQVREHPGHFFKPGYPLLYFCYNLLELFFPQMTGFYTVHGPAPFLKSTYEKIWELEGEYIREISHNRFRSERDINQYLFREFQKLSGNFKPANAERHFEYHELEDDNRKCLKMIAAKGRKGLGRCDILCLNDVGKVTDQRRVKEELREAFAKSFPLPSSFEKQEELP